MKKIKILRIIARLNIGGPAIHVVLLTEGLDKSRFASSLICGKISQDEGDMSYYAFEKGIKPCFIPELKREFGFWDDLKAFLKIYKIIKNMRPDIIHTHTAKAGALGRSAAILYNFFNPFARKHIKLVHTFHGHIFEGYFDKFKTAIFIFIERFLVLFTCKIITVSESVKQELLFLGICPDNKIKVIPLGLELDKFLAIAPNNNSVLNIGIVGRLVPIKNHSLFLDAIAQLIKDNPHLKTGFRVIGDGQLRKGLEEYSHRLGLDKYVEFLGWQKDLVKIYSQLDIVALTSRNEGTPVSVIEAMASGRAVVATDAGGIRDLLSKEIDCGIRPNADFEVLERGIIVKQADSISFAKALALLVNNNALRIELGKAGRDFVKSRFSKERLIKDIENLYIMI